MDNSLAHLNVIEASPCSVACPLGTNVKAYVSLIAAGKFTEALDSVRRRNPFPGICGRVCPHECEEQCIRNDIDAPVSIGLLKRFIADYELRLGILPRPPISKNTQGTAAVIGAGPSGLTCAADLARANIKVTVFESLPVAGGMMAVGIPSYRLPRDILNIEIDAIKALGVDIRLNTAIGKDIAFSSITADFNHVYIACGAHIPTPLSLESEESVSDGMINSLAFLQKASLGTAKKPGTKVIVIGGGNTAVDCARTALRLGSEVHIMYRRSREEMPAYAHEVIEAKQEGITLTFLAMPVRILHKRGNITGLKCIRMELGEKDESGRCRPVPIQDSEFIVECDAIIPAIGQQADLSFLSDAHDISTSGHFIDADSETMSAGMAHVYAGGDAAGPADLINAVNAGHKAADSILADAGKPPQFAAAVQRSGHEELSIELPSPLAGSRHKADILDAETRKASFDEVVKGMTEAQAIEEAQRCLRCGPCHECDTCVGVCDTQQAIMRDVETGSEMLVRITPELGEELKEHKCPDIIFRNTAYTMHSFHAAIAEDECRGCGLCEQVCPFRAIQILYKGNAILCAQVNETMCRGCGLCIAACPTDAIEQEGFSSSGISRRLKNIQHMRPGSGIAVFACWWNQVIPDLPDTETIKVMCTGRIKGGDVLQAFENGACHVLMQGCSEQSCHYGSLEQTKTNIDRIEKTSKLLGITDQRFRVVRSEQEMHHFRENIRENRSVVSEPEIAAPNRYASHALGVNSPRTEAVHSASRNNHHINTSGIHKLISRHGIPYILEAPEDFNKACPVAQVNPDFSPQDIAAYAKQTPDELPEYPLIWECLTCGKCSRESNGKVNMSDFIRGIREYAFKADFHGTSTHGNMIMAAQRLNADPAFTPPSPSWAEGLNISSGKNRYLYWAGGAAVLAAIMPELKPSPLETARAEVKILNRLGIKPMLPAHERFSGHDLLWTGDTEHFIKLAELNIKTINDSGAETVIVSSPHDLYTLKKSYPEFCAKPDVEIVHITEFIADRISKLKFRELRKKVTFHDPCRLGRGMDIYQAPRSILKAIPGIELVEMKHAQQDSMCCGTACWTSCNAYSKLMQVNRIREAVSSEAEIMVTACNECALHFSCTQRPEAWQQVHIEIQNLVSLAMSLLED